MSPTFEPQYSDAVVLAASERRALPCMANQTWITDPKRLGFMLARYKHVGCMFRGLSNVLELGCGDGFGTNVTATYVENIYAIDADQILIEEANHFSPRSNIVFHQCLVGDDLPESFPAEFDGIFALDVFEHISSDSSNSFAEFVKSSLSSNGQFICGIPSLESQAYASPGSKAGHVNCLNGYDFRSFWLNHFHSVNLFGMNDEVLHTGFVPMCHYLFAVCSHKYSNDD